MLKKHNHAVLALIIANIIWGAASPLFKLSLQNLPAFTLAFLRFYGAMLILLPFAIRDLWVKKEDWLNLLLLSLFGITINITFFFYGLEKAPSINAPIIGSAGPIFLYLYSILILREKFHPKILVGTIVSLAGVMTVVGQPLLSGKLDGEILGNFFFILATLGAVGHAVLSKQIIHKYKAATITFWSFFIGSFTFLPLFIKELVIYHPFNTIDQRGWMGLFFGIFFSSALAYFLFEWGIKKIEAQEVGLFTYIDPLAAIILAVPLLGEVITPVFLTGSLLVFGGIFIAEGRLHWHPFHKLR